MSRAVMSRAVMSRAVMSRAALSGMVMPWDIIPCGFPLKRGGVGPAQQIAQVVDFLRALGAAQHEIVVAIAQQGGRGRPDGGQQRRAHHERTADVIGGQQQHRGEIGLEERFRHRSPRRQAELVGVEATGARMQPAGDGEGAQSVVAEFVSRRQEGDQPRFVPARQRCVPGDGVGGVEDGEPLRRVRRVALDRGTHRPARPRVGRQNGDAPARP